MGRYSRRQKPSLEYYGKYRTIEAMGSSEPSTQSFRNGDLLYLISVCFSLIVKNFELLYNGPSLLVAIA